MGEFVWFHTVADERRSAKVAGQLEKAGCRIRRRCSVHTVDGKTEYHIQIHPDDRGRAESAFWGDVDGGRTATSDGTAAHSEPAPIALLKRCWRKLLGRA
jgi:hypothetical protein